MTLALAKHLVEHRLVPANAMDDALQRQVLFGGSLDTNLLEMGLVTEPSITQALCAAYQVPMATPRLLGQRDPRAIKLLPSRLSQKYQILPVLISGRSLFVLTCAPLDPVVVREIELLLSLPLVPHLVCEARLTILFKEWLEVEIEPRFAALGEKLGAFRGAEPARARLPVPPPPPVAAKPVPVASSIQIDKKKMAVVLGDVETSERQEEARRTKARTGAISLKNATRGCLSATDRDTIVDTTLRFARQFIPFVGLFVINNDSVLGWDAVGSEDARERIRKIRLSGGMASVLHTVLQTNSPYLGPIPDQLGNNQLLQALDRKRPQNVLIIPIQIQKRIIALLYGDAAEQTIHGGRIADLLVFASRLAAAFEQLILGKKSEPQGGDEKRQASAPSPKPSPRPAALAQPASPPAVSAPAPVAAQSVLRPEESLVSTNDVLDLPEWDDSMIAEARKNWQPLEETAAPETAATKLSKWEAEQSVFQPTPEDALPSFPVAAEEKPALEPAEQRVKLEDAPEPTDQGPSEIEGNWEETDRLEPTEGGPPPLPIVEDRSTQPVAAARAAQPSVVMSPEDRGSFAPATSSSWGSLAETLAKDVDPDRTQYAFEQLAKGGAEAIDALLAFFPGRLRQGAPSAAEGASSLSQCGELLRCLIQIGPVAGPALASRLGHSDSMVRLYATKLLGEIFYPPAVQQIARRLYDLEVEVRRAAIEVLQAYRKTHEFDRMLKQLRDQLRYPPPTLQAIAAALLGNFKDREAIPLLIDQVRAAQPLVSRAAIETLCHLTRQSFGNSVSRWNHWWEVNQQEHRIHWLIQGLHSKDVNTRYGAHQELVSITHENFGFQIDASKEVREAAVGRWEQWWRDKGRITYFVT